MKMSTQFIGATREFCTIQNHVAAPYFRKTFVCENDVQQAVLTICGLGFYELYLNGKNITKGPLAPYISNPDHLLYYDTYDVANQLKEGVNVLGILLGNGMQNALGGFVWDFDKATFRGVPRVALCLSITDGSGQVTELETDGSFKVHASPILYDDLRIGEIYDARLELDGWNLSEFDDSSWENAYITEMPRGEAVEPIVEPIVATQELMPVSVSPHEGGYLYDFGINMSGVCRMKISGQPGQKIILQYGEHLENGKLDLKNIGFDHAPGFLQQDVYICRGGNKEVYTPRFTYHGFRYVLVQGLVSSQATKELLTYLVMNTDLKEVGGFSCSDDTVNTLQLLTRRSTLSNFHYLPTDCPHREKNGWTADAALSAEHTLLNLTPEKGYRDWMRNICKAMSDKGALPGIVPTGGWGFRWGNGPAWDSVLVYLPYFTYVYRKDKVIVEQSTHAIFRYLDYLTTRMDEQGLLAIGLGDWCQPNLPASKYICPLLVSDSIISMDIAAKAAFLFDEMGMIRQGDFARSLTKTLRENIRRRLVNWQTLTVSGNCQTAQAMALFYGVFDQEEQQGAFKVLLSLIHKENDHMDTGVLGGRVIFHVLSQFGYSDLAYKMITQPTFPSYGNWVQRGAVTLWEDFQPPGRRVTSQNHHFWGDISNWFIQNLAGIRYNPRRNDWNQADIRPSFVEALTHAEGHHICPKGKIAVQWERTAEGVTLRVDSPAAMTGNIVLPGGYVFEDGKKDIPLQSGVYGVIKR